MNFVCVGGWFLLLIFLFCFLHFHNVLTFVFYIYLLGRERKREYDWGGLENEKVIGGVRQKEGIWSKYNVYFLKINIKGFESSKVIWFRGNFCIVISRRSLIQRRLRFYKVYKVVYCKWWRRGTRRDGRMEGVREREIDLTSTCFLVLCVLSSGDIWATSWHHTFWKTESKDTIHSKFWKTD